MTAQAKRYTPVDYLSGSKKVGGTYNAWDTYGQGAPDMGHGKGPGDPYHVVQKKVTPRPAWMGPGQVRPKWATPIGSMNGTPSQGNSTSSALGGIVARAADDPRIEAIRRRLRGLK